MDNFLIYFSLVLYLNLINKTLGLAEVIDFINNNNTRQWNPYIISKCKHNIPKYYAPCQYKNLKIAHELIFPDFKIRAPNFINEQDKKYFEILANSDHSDFKDRFRYDGEYCIYKSMHGQNLVFHNVKINVLSNLWNKNQCVCGNTSINNFEQFDPKKLGNNSKINIIPYGLLDNIPDSWSFQHFIDRGILPIIQSSYIRRNNNTYGIIASKSDVTLKFWKIFGFDPSHVVTKFPVFVKKLIFSCRSVLIHPWYFLQLQQKMKIKVDVPLDQRKYILYLSRNEGTKNNRRKILNEKELIYEVKKLLQIRNKGETVQIINPLALSIFQIKELLSQTKAIIAPHGGALYNVLFAPQQTLIIEIIPKERFAIMFFELSSIMQHNYWMIPINSTKEKDNNLIISITDILNILKSQLGKKRENVLLEYYMWNSKT